MAAAEQTKRTYAEREKAAVHDAKALLRGDDECRCKVCRKVRAAEEKERAV